MRTALVLTLAALVALGGCARQEASLDGANRVAVWLTDAPLDEATALIVEFGRVDLVPSHDGEHDGIETIAEAPGAIDVLALQNGVVHELGDIVVPDGSYGQIRLIVESATLHFGDATYDVDVPSGAQSGLKILIEPPLVASGGSLHEVVIDFDVLRGVVETPPGSGRYLLKPTAIRAFSEAGAIRGTVVAAGAGPELAGVRVDATPAGGGEAVGSTITDDDGFFMFRALLEGTYDLTFGLAGFATASVPDVAVTVAGTTDVGTVELDPSE